MWTGYSSGIENKTVFRITSKTVLEMPWGGGTALCSILETVLNFAEVFCMYEMAEGRGFEPPIPLSMLVFETSALSRSATPPHEKSKEQ